MAQTQYLIMWSMLIFFVFLVIYISINKDFKLNLSKFKDKRSKKDFNRRVDVKLLGWRNISVPSNKITPFLPLIPFLIVVYIFMNHYVFFAVITSDSMSPTFEKGDIVLMQSVDTDAEEDDIIMFNNKNPRGIHPPVIHRIENVTEEGYITKGDSTNIPDDWVVEEDEVTAKAVTVSGKPVVIPNVGNYFIQDYKAQGKYADEFVFTSLMVTLLKDIGVAVFSTCVGLYIILTIRDSYRLGK
ncbi:MAG: signal peptidase I [Thermoplasmata archaeon]|nr:MAG: signal peptidase I [Thermoplasmata archaeon]